MNAQEKIELNSLLNDCWLSHAGQVCIYVLYDDEINLTWSCYLILKGILYVAPIRRLCGKFCRKIRMIRGGST